MLICLFLSQIEPKKVIQALADPSWVEAMQEELLQFRLQKVWTLVDLPNGKRAIRTKWVFRNKKDERGIVVRNKQDWLHRIEESEEVYVCQPPGFEDPQFLNKVYKVEKALYGLHQALRAWYETLSTYFLENRFRRGIIDKTLFIKKDKGDILLVQVYVDDIIFGSTKKSLCTEFEVKTASTLMDPKKALIKDAEAEDVDVHLYRSMIGSLMYLTASRPDIMFAVCACARFQVGFSKETTGSEGFQEITATVRIVDNGEQEITATVDGKEFTFTEASVRRHLQLADADADEAVYEEWDDSVERATINAASLDAAQDSDRVLALETDLRQTKKVYGDAYTKLIMKGRMIEEIDQDAGIALVTPTHSQEDQPEDQLGVLSATKVLAKEAKVHTYTRRRRAVTTAEESVSIAGASMPVSTVGMVQDPSPVVVKDKGKAKVDKSEPKLTKTKLLERQERLGLEAAMKLQEQFDEEERLRMAREHEEASSFHFEEWENIQARIEVDEEIAVRLQAKEREELTIKERSRLFVELMDKRKKYFAEKRAEEKRNKPLIQAQQRTYMSNYIKHMGSHTLQQLRIYSFHKLKELFETTMKNVNTFTPMKTDDRRRASELAARSSQATVTEAEEAYQFFEDMLKIFDREDLVKLWSLVKERFSSTEPTDEKERTL
ncbi:putative ribonuclease H-like domain-containing protein [Tanacetum coccineum]